MCVCVRSSKVVFAALNNSLCSRHSRQLHLYLCSVRKALQNPTETRRNGTKRVWNTFGVNVPQSNVLREKTMDQLQFSFERQLPPPEPQKGGGRGVVCRYWLRQRCMKGDKCEFIHRVRGCACVYVCAWHVRGHVSLRLFVCVFVCVCVPHSVCMCVCVCSSTTVPRK